MGCLHDFHNCAELGHAENDGPLAPVFMLLPQPPAPPTREELEDLILALAGQMGFTSDWPRTFSGAVASLFVVAKRLRASREVPQPPPPPTPEQIAREVLAWLIEGKEIGLHAVAVKLALSRQEDEVCRRWAERERAYLRETGQEEAGDTDTHESVAPPTLREIEDALLAWAVAGDTRELKNGDPVCMALLGIADRLAASRETLQDAPGVDSGRSTPSGVVLEPPPRQEGAVEALARARLTLQLINDWATMDRDGERFPWIANETAAALEGLE